MRTIGYARVSSREQAENSHALEQQITRLKTAGATEIFSDVESGTKDDRYAFNLVMEMVRQQQVDEVIFTRLDRMTRSLLTLRKAVDDFKRSGVNLKVLDDSIDLSTAGGKFHIHLLGALAEMEVDRLSERVKHGWQHLRDKKVAMNPPFGYAKVDNNFKLDHTPFLCLLDSKEEMSKAAIATDIIQTFFREKGLNATIRVINQRYGIHRFNYGYHSGVGTRGLFRWSPSGMSNWLTSPVLQGHTVYLRNRNHSAPELWVVHYNTHPDECLISPDQAQQIKEILTHNKQVRGFGTQALKYPLSGLVYCGECRGVCYSSSSRRNYKHPERGYNYYFQCHNYPLRACGQKKLVRMDKTEEAVIAVLTQRSEAIANLSDSPQEQFEPLELKELKIQLTQLETIPGNNPAIEAAKRDLRVQIENFQYQIRQVDQALQGNREMLLRVMQDPCYWQTLRDEEKREIYRNLVKKIVVRNGDIEQVILKV